MATPTSTPQYILYSDSVEVKKDGEAKTISQLASTMRHISEIINDRARHEKLSFNPWHGLAAHRPLGNVMRARYEAY